MSTLVELQKLSDGKFHRLADSLLRRVEVRYGRLRTHGLNERGESIVGQPDSYVGDSATNCSIAFCYTVQRRRWGHKIVEDIQKAVESSPSVTEIVVAVPRDVDREKQACGLLNWVEVARRAAGCAMLRMIDGKEITQLLDSDHEDLRYEHLRIPFSRLSGSSILAGAQFSTNATIDSLHASGRYDPARYTPRSADRDLYSVWQQALRREDGENRSKPVRLVALVNDSGVGKTSLVCSFARSLGEVLPVLLVPGRDLALGSHDVLVTHAIHALQGTLDSSIRVGEEAAIVRYLSRTAPLTLIIDGLDETHATESVRSAISQWLRSRLAEHCVLIVTSRREFWRKCADPSWARWMPKAAHDDRKPQPTRRQNDLERLSPSDGLRIPNRFSEDELEAAWTRAGHVRAELFELGRAARAELRHPFTLRIFLDLRAQQGVPLAVTSQTQLMDLWLRHRLEQEAMPDKWISIAEFEKALRSVARLTCEADGGAVRIDELVSIPRFDPVNPPGPVVQRLIDANILEALPITNSIRFALEAVDDFYRAEADLEDIRIESTACARRISQQTFTEVYPRLVRIGHRLVRDDVRHAFVDGLSDFSPEMAAVVLCASPGAYSTSLRSRIADSLSRGIRSPFRVEAAFAIDLLGSVDCPEVCDVLERAVLPSNDLHRYLKAIAAKAFISLGSVRAVHFVYQWAQLGIYQGNDTYYFLEFVTAIRNSKPEFKKALATLAYSGLQALSADPHHVRALYWLACLADDRLVEDLHERMGKNRFLHAYENRALIATGTDAAGRLFASSILAVGTRVSQLSGDLQHSDERSKLHWTILQYSPDVQYLPSRLFTQHLEPLIDHIDVDVSWIATDFAKKARVSALMYRAAVASTRFGNIAGSSMERNRTTVSSEEWMSWWKSTDDPAVQMQLLILAPPAPSADIEQVLSVCLESSQLRRRAARVIGEYGCARLAVQLRLLLEQADGACDQLAKASVARALGDLRDNACVPLLQNLATQTTEWFTQHEAIASLGIIGSPMAEKALNEMLELPRLEESVVTALLACGTPTAVSTVLSRAHQKDEPAEWLRERLAYLLWMRGHRRGQYWTHVHTGPLVDLVSQSQAPGAGGEALQWMHAFEMIDSDEVRGLLRRQLSPYGMEENPTQTDLGSLSLHGMCLDELVERGDQSAIPYVFDRRASEDDESYVAVVEDRLAKFPSGPVAAEIVGRLRQAAGNSAITRLLALLGRFGGSSDAHSVERFMAHDNILIKNIACEVRLRLTDYSRVPYGWREL